MGADKRMGEGTRTLETRMARKTRKGVSRFSRPFVNFVFHRSHQPIQRVQRFEGLAEEEIGVMDRQIDALSHGQLAHSHCL